MKTLIIILSLLILVACGGDTKSGVSEAAISGGNPANGEKLFDNRCLACHAIEADEERVGPSVAGLATESAKIINDSNYTGEAQTAEAYILESIIDPEAYLTEGYAPVMSTNYGDQLSEQELADLVAYLMTFK